MKRIVNVLWYKTSNVGDTTTSPLDYFEFPLPVEKRDIKEDCSGLEDAFVILGGGGIIHLPAPDYNNGVLGYWDGLTKLGKYRVIWGMGHNIHYNNHHDLMNMKLPPMNKFQLVGMRDKTYLWEPRFFHVPCVSCMSTYFNFPTYGGGFKAVFHEHTNCNLDVPILRCEQASFNEVLKFLLNADCVYTDSYHVMYWAELMEKPVILTKTPSSKFVFHQPVSLKAARAKNQVFYREVLHLLKQYMEEEE